MERGNALRLIGCGLAFLLGATDEVLARWLSEAPGGEGSSTDLVCTHPGRRNRALGAPERLNDDGKESGYLRLSQRDWSDTYAPAAAEVAAAVERAWDHPCDEEATHAPACKKVAFCSFIAIILAKFSAKPCSSEPPRAMCPAMPLGATYASFIM